tara:strand:- start:204 stop:677 length:474 start_codon:yes stop_codon:yes gene_type:complete
MLEKIYSSHNKWINTTLKFGCTQEEAEDIVGKMYLIIGTMLNKGLNISYGDEGVNYYYIYLTLKTSFLQFKNKQNKENKISIDLVYNIEADEYVDYDTPNEIVLDELDKLHWYDKKIYNLVEGVDCSMTKLSNQTNISYHSIYNTYRKVKKHLKSKL